MAVWGGRTSQGELDDFLGSVRGNPSVTCPGPVKITDMHSRMMGSKP